MLTTLRRLAAVSAMAVAALNASDKSVVPPIPEQWTRWSPRPDLQPAADIVEEGGSRYLRLQSRNFASYGKWIAGGTVRAGDWYRVEVLYRTTSVRSEDTSVAILASWRAGRNKDVQRDYIDAVTRQSDGWTRAVRILKAPSPADSVSLELGLRWSEAGSSILWKSASVVPVPPPASRRARIVTTRIQPGPGATVEKNVAQMADILDQVGARKPDLVLFTENFVDRGVGRPLVETAQTVPGPATEVLADRARRYKTWVATSLHEREGDLIYNTAVLIDREGRIAGKYRKVHLATIEGENGITPGSDYPVFDTDFGRVGMLVCWDNWFGEAARALRLQGAEILLLPIAGDGVPDHWDLVSRTRAIDNGMFLVAASTSATSPSRIVDPYGKVLAETASGFVAADIDLNSEARVFWLSVGPSLGDPKSLYLKERRPDTYRGLASGARP